MIHSTTLTGEAFGKVTNSQIYIHSTIRTTNFECLFFNSLVLKNRCAVVLSIKVSPFMAVFFIIIIQLIGTGLAALNCFKDTFYRLQC